MFFIMDEHYKTISKHENKETILKYFENLKSTKNNYPLTKDKMYILIEGIEIDYAWGD